jgi:3-hydroxyisobutyrate dehydrogenase
MAVQSQHHTIAVLGLGVMGGRMAAVLAERCPVRGFDPVAATRDAVARTGVATFETAGEAVDGADLIFLSLPNPEVVRAVIDDLGDTTSGKLVFNLSTIDPSTAREAAEALKRHGAGYVDAPILGRPASCGKWTLVCGGSEGDVAVLDQIATGSIARAVIRVGGVGAGSTLKLLNNLMFGAVNAITAEVIDLAERSGLDPARFTEIISESGAGHVSPLFRDIAPRMAAHNYDDPEFAVKMLAKDVRLGTELAAEIDQPAPMANQIRMITDQAMARGLADLDSAALVEVYRSSDS